MTLQIVIVEREPLLRSCLQQLLGAAPGMSVAGAADTIEHAERLPAVTVADVALLGTTVADLEDTEGVRRMLVRFPRARVVMLGTVEEPALVIAALRAGADGYLTRDISPQALIRSLQGLQRGEAPLSRGVTRLLVEAIRLGAPAPCDEGSVDRLTVREREVLAEVMRGWSNGEIARRLHVSESTVKTHVSNILRKTGSRSRFIFQPARAAV